MQGCLYGRCRIAVATPPFGSPTCLVRRHLLAQQLRFVHHHQQPETSAQPPHRSGSDLPSSRILSDADLKTLLGPSRFHDLAGKSLSLSQSKPYPNNDLSTTQPAPLELPPKPKPPQPGSALPLATRARYLFNIGKAYLRLYKTGLVNVWHNYRELRSTIQPKLTSPTSIRSRSARLDFLVRHSGPVLQDQPNPQTRSTTQHGLPTITRRDYHLSLRTRKDLIKLPIFAVILTIFGEFTPLIILILGSRVVPGPCVIPRQAQADWIALFARVESFNDISTSAQAAERRGDDLTKRRHLQAYLLGLVRYPAPLSGPMADSISRRRTLPALRRHLNHLLNDAILVRREGGYARLSPTDVLDCVRRCPLPETTEILRKARNHNGGKVEADDALKASLVPLLDKEARRLVQTYQELLRDE